jgi:hypothetical protein
VTARIKKVQKRDPQTVFVLPECGNAPLERRSAGRTNYNSNWDDVTSVAETADDSIRAAGIDPEAGVGTRIVSAHSNGGRALKKALEAHPDGSGLRADQLELEDCLYGDWADFIEDWAATENGRAASRVIYYHGNNVVDPENTGPDGISRAFGERYLRVEAGSHNAASARFMDDLGHEGHENGLSGESVREE